MLDDGRGGRGVPDWITYHSRWVSAGSVGFALGSSTVWACSLLARRGKSDEPTGKSERSVTTPRSGFSYFTVSTLDRRLVNNL